MEKIPVFESLSKTLERSIGNFPIETPDDRRYKSGLASEYYDKLCKYINDFQDSLDQDNEVGARLVNFGESLTFHIEDVGYWNPYLIIFYGKTDNGNPVELIQNVSQISILLMKLPRLDNKKPKAKMGFTPPDNANKKENKSSGII